MRHGRRPVLRCHTSVLRTLLPGVTPPEVGASDSETADDAEIVRTWISQMDVLTIGVQGPNQELLDRLITLLRDDAKTRVLRVDRLPVSANGESGEYILLTGRRRRVPAQDAAADERVSTDSSESSLVDVEVTLSAHQEGVGSVASGFAERLGMSGDLAADLRFAAEWHDSGKADPRFQRWLHGGSEFKALVQAEPLAKGKARQSSPLARRLARERTGYPKGGRHEVMSVALMESNSEQLAAYAGDWRLVLHLIAGHHGHCRPLAPFVPDLNPVEVKFSRGEFACCASSAHGLARLDSGIADRFWQLVRAYGWWGLAWLEALLRLADQRQSESEQR